MSDVIARKSVITSFDSDLKGLEKGSADAKKLVSGVQDVSQKTTTALKGASQSVKQLATEQLRLGDTIREALGPVGGIVTRIASAFVGVLQSVRAAAVGVRAFSLALVATGIGAIVVILGALAAAFLSTERGGDALQKQLTRLKVIFDSLLGALQDASFEVVDWFKTLFEDPVEAIKILGNAIKTELIERFEALKTIGPAIVKIFSKDWKEGLGDLGKAWAKVTLGIDDFSGALGRAVTTADKLFEATERLEEQEKVLALTIARLGSAYQDAREDAIDVELSIEKRLEASAKARELNLQIAEKQIEVERTKLQIQKLQNSTSDTSVKLQQQELDTEAKIETIQNQARRENERFLKQEIRIRKEAEAARIEAIKKLREKTGESKLLPDILSRQFIVFERKIGDLKKALQAAFEVDDQEAIKSIQKTISALESEIKAFKIKSGDQSVIEEYLGLGTDSKKALDNFFAELKKKQDALNEANRNKEIDEREEEEEKRQKKKLENIDNLKKAVQDSAVEIVNILANINQAQIDQFNNAIALQTERVSRFEELAETGSARQLIIEEERLQKMEAARAAAVEKQQRLAAAQILINQAVTISESIKAIASAFGTGGPLGIVTGIAMTAALGIALAGVASNVSGLFGSIPAFAGGVESLQGPGTGKSDSIMSRLSKGERVTDAVTNHKMNTVARGVFPNRLLPDAVSAYMSTPEISAAMYNMAASTERGFKELLSETQLMRSELKRLKVTILARGSELASMVTTSELTDSWKKSG